MTESNVTDYSLNESATRAKLAARGIGYSWGVAEDAARALYWLSARGIDGYTALCVVLAGIDSGLLGAPSELNDNWKSERGDLCPLMTGICVSDCAGRVIDMQSITLSNLAYPVLTLPFLSDIALAHSCTVQFTCAGFEAVISKDDVALIGDSTIACVDVATVACTNNSIDISGSSYKKYSQCKNRVSIDASVWQQLGEYAHRTYAPATDQSRLLGAGAGIVDSD